MSKPIKSEEYILNMSIIEPARNYLKHGEKAGDATKEKEHAEYIKNIFEQGLNIAVGSTKIEYKNGKLIRDGQEVDISETKRETILEYLAKKAQAREQQGR